MRKRGRPAGSCSHDYLVLGHKVLELSEINPTLSMSALARHYGVSEVFVSKVMGNPGRYREDPGERPVPVFVGSGI
jgi:hypothetical protein